MSNTPGESKLNTDCIICLELADEALVTACCIDIICKECYQKIYQKFKSKDCPKCKHSNFEVRQELMIRKFIREISPEIQILPKPLTGGTYIIKLRQLDTLDMLFQRACEKTGVPTDKMRFTFEGKNLELNKKSLRSTGIHQCSKVHQLGRLKGGK